MTDTDEPHKLEDITCATSCGRVKSFQRPFKYESISNRVLIGSIVLSKMSNASPFQYRAGYKRGIRKSRVRQAGDELVTTEARDLSKQERIDLMMELGIEDMKSFDPEAQDDVEDEEKVVETPPPSEEARQDDPATEVEEEPSVPSEPQPQSKETEKLENEWMMEPQIQLPSLRNYCSRCWAANFVDDRAQPDCMFIHPSGDVYQHEEPNLAVLPCTLNHPKKVTENDCKWFHALESKNGSGGGVETVLRCLKWPFSLSPDFVDVAAELLDYCFSLDYCLKTSDPDDAESSCSLTKSECSSSRIQRKIYSKESESLNVFRRQMYTKEMESDAIRRKIYAKEKEKAMVLLFDEVWTRIRSIPSLKQQLPKLSLIFLKFLFSSDEKLSIVTVNKVLEDDSSKDLDKEEFAVQFCETLDILQKSDQRWGKRPVKFGEDSLFGKLTLMTKLATLFGPQVAEKYFLPRFIALTSHNAYDVRRLCVYRFHEMVYSVSSSAVETILLPAFLKLCHDPETEVRSPCLVAIIAISSKLPMKLRITILAPVYYKLLNRQRALSEEMMFLAFFPTFCPFITTLAHQPIASLELNNDCDVVLSYLNRSEFGFEINFLAASYSKSDDWNYNDQNNGVFPGKDHIWEDVDDPPSSPKNEVGNVSFLNRAEEYKSFDYWREPVDDCYLHSEVIDIMRDKWTGSVEWIEEYWRRLIHEEGVNESSPEPSGKSTYAQSKEGRFYAAIRAKYQSHDSKEEESINSLKSSKLVSSLLVKYYLSEKRLRWVASSVAAKSLAIFLPAVALTLGQENWHLLRMAFNLLASHEEWKIRLAIAAIIHELALLLTKEQTQEDLLPVFKSVMEDLDLVRLGALKNLASFLGSLNASARTTFLTRFSDFLGPDFRLREMLVDQLILVLPLFSACDIITFILPFVILVLQDKIAAVRQKSISLACELSLLIYMEEEELTFNVLKKFTEHLASSSEWRHRQTFANLAAVLVMEKAAGPKSLDQVVLPHLIGLCRDKVVNVRIAVARSLRDILQSNNVPFSGSDLEKAPDIDTALDILSYDEDPDVRELSSPQVDRW